MQISSPHSFHIPVMGIGFTIDCPVKVARFGIDSTMSIAEDGLIEQMRKLHSEKWNIPYTYIPNTEYDYRSKRITAYLNLIEYIVQEQSKQIKTQPFDADSEISKYFNILPDNSPLKVSYLKSQLLKGEERVNAENQLREKMVSGAIEVNIMTKLDKQNLDKEGNPQPSEFSDALSALRGFANSALSSSVIFSAGMNPRLYGYCETFTDFLPDKNGYQKKKIILKVSDYRSAIIQGKFLAKKGLWISEFRIESGLNCGGHAFATEGLLMGPILEEFKEKRDELFDTLYEICESSLIAAGKFGYGKKPTGKISAQGGIGTAFENRFLLEYYQLDSAGWGSPFLLVPEVTNVDDRTLQSLATAEPDDYYLSHASPLGVPFNNFRKSSSEEQRMQRIENGKPGSPCKKKFLEFDSEFTKQPICTASTKYQYFKLRQLKEELKANDINEVEYQAKIKLVTEKDCLCEGLSAPALIVNDIHQTNKYNAVTICPGPNLAFFSGVFTLNQMVDHIYGRSNILNQVPRPNLFVNELKLYVKYLINEKAGISVQVTQKKDAYFIKFKENLLSGITYYRQLVDKMEGQAEELFQGMLNELAQIENSILLIGVNTQTAKSI
jgi:hypothetical protein